MLVLSRHRDETVVATMTLEAMAELLRSVGAAVDLIGIGSARLEITTTVVEIRGDKARLGYDATFAGRKLCRELPIHRGEVNDKIDRNERANLGY